MKFMTSVEVGKMIRCSAAKVTRLASEGKLPASKLGKTWVFVKDEVEEFVTSSRFIPPSRGKLPKNCKPVTYRIPEPLDKRIREIAFQTSRPLSEVAAIALQSWVDLIDKRVNSQGVFPIQVTPISKEQALGPLEHRR